MRYLAVRKGTALISVCRIARKNFLRWTRRVRSKCLQKQNRPEHESGCSHVLALVYRKLLFCFKNGNREKRLCLGSLHILYHHTIDFTHITDSAIIPFLGCIQLSQIIMLSEKLCPLRSCGISCKELRHMRYFPIPGC